MLNEEMKVKLFEKVLELEHLAEISTFDGRNYCEQSDGAFQMLQIMGLGSAYIRWAFGK